MNKRVKNLLIIGGIALGVIGLIIFINFILPLFIGFKMLTNFFEKQEERYDFNEKGVIEYVQDTHGLDVEIIGKFDPPGYRLTAYSYIVQTKDEDEIIFNVKKGTIQSKIKGDDYDKMKKYHSITEKIKKSHYFDRLKDLGFVDFYYGFDWLFSDNHIRPELKLILPKDEKYTEDVIEHIYEAIFIINEMNMDVLLDYDEAINEFTVHSAIESKYDDFQGKIKVDLDYKKSSFDSFNQSIAAQYPYTFSKELIKPYVSDIETLEEYLSMTKFYNDDLEAALKCDVIESVSDCQEFLIILERNDELTDKKEFRYDKSSLLDELWLFIQSIQESKLPINKIKINNLYVPYDLADQKYSEEEWIEQGEDIFINFKDVSIEEIKSLSSQDEIYFNEYKD